MAEEKKAPEAKERVRPGKDKADERKPAQQEAGKYAVEFSYAYQARVEEVVGRTGTRGEAIQVRCKVLDGRDKNKILRRNVKGPIQVGDVLMLRETEIEAKKLSTGGRGNV